MTMTTLRRVAAGLVCVALCALAAACSDDDSPTGTGSALTSDDMLVEACERAGECNASTPDDIALCPANVLPELGEDDIAYLDGLARLDATQRDAVFDCFATEVCTRFGGSVLNMSDSDLMETLALCAAGKVAPRRWK
jgi:hypothetical protein